MPRVLPPDHGQRVSAGQLANMTPAQLELRARAAANARWAATPLAERRDGARAGQAGLLAKFEAQIPAAITDPAERAQRALQLHRSHMQRLSLRSSRARSRKAGAADARTA